MIFICWWLSHVDLLIVDLCVYCLGCRYPKFVDALRDLDDCLSMVLLFAALPAIEREKIEVKRVHNCRRFLNRFLLQVFVHAIVRW